jgi:hypothetical protein
MTTGLQISNGTDFDSLFQTGSGTQLLYTYGSNGQDIGQRYLPASSGSAYGSTGFYNPSGTDVGNLLCKAGSNYHITMTVGCYVISSKVSSYGYWVGRYGSVNRIPFWGTNALLVGLYTNTISGNIYQHWCVIYDRNITFSSIQINGVTFTYDGDISEDTKYRYYLNSTKSNVLNMASSTGATLNLTFNPAPNGYS